MEKTYRKQYRKNGHKENKIGMPLGIHDCNGVELCVGDEIIFDDIECIILWNDSYRCYCAYYIYSGMPIEERTNKYDVRQYYKCSVLKMDDGARMRIVKIA